MGRIPSSGSSIYMLIQPVIIASRNELMLAAKERGVKNFRVLNKHGLGEVLKNIGDQKAVDVIVAGAVVRWKSGWGKKKAKNESQS